MAEYSESSQGFAMGKPVDVLIVGAGPAGLMAAATLARYGVSFRIIDKNPQKVQVGRASGIQPRTIEILRSLGMYSTLEALGSRMCETAFYSKEVGGSLECTDIGPVITNATPNPYVLVAHQGNTESTFINDLLFHGATVDRPVRFIGFRNLHNDGYPLAARLQNPNTGMTEEVPAKYILGCDGAGSNVRQTLQITSDIQESRDSWAVADTCITTNFPDVRRRCAIRTDEASVMLIPTATGVRIYTLLSEQDVSKLERSRYDGKGHAGENEETVIGVLSRRAKAALKPYRFEIESVEWVSHTHSPKAGQGMNVSMTDAYNLTWKLALQIRGLAAPGLLDTYELERQHIAKQLIEFDHAFAALFASSDSLQSRKLHDIYTESQGFTSGIGHRYPPSILVKDVVGLDIDQEALEPLTPGKRLYPIALTKHISGARMDLVDELPSNGNFHLFIFAGNGGLQNPEFKHAADFLSSSPSSPLSTYSTPHETKNNDIFEDRESLLDLSLIHTADHLQLRIASLPDPFRTWQSRVYEDVGGKGHAELGLAGEQGAVVVVRPDGYVGLVTSFKHIHETAAYLDGVLKKP